jgi:hypothetical protein
MAVPAIISTGVNGDAFLMKCDLSCIHGKCDVKCTNQVINATMKVMIKWNEKVNYT